MEHILQHQSVASFLKVELENRKRYNNSYSLRAFAKDLGLSPSGLSEIIRGKKKLSPAAANRIAKQLKFSEEERKSLIVLSVPESKRTDHTLNKAKETLQIVRDQKQLTLEVFNFISEPYHLTILEAFKNENFRSNPTELIELLNIDSHKFQRVIETLLKLKLLDGKLNRTENRLPTPQDLPGSAVREHQKNILRKAENALDTQSISEREFQNTQLIFSKENLSRAKQKIRAFQAEMVKEFGVSEHKAQDVYSLSIQFFNVTKK